ETRLFEKSRISETGGLAPRRFSHVSEIVSLPVLGGHAGVVGVLPSVVRTEKMLPAAVRQLRRRPAAGELWADSRRRRAARFASRLLLWRLDHLLKFACVPCPSLWMGMRTVCNMPTQSRGHGTQLKSIAPQASACGYVRLVVGRFSLRYNNE